MLPADCGPWKRYCVGRRRHGEGTVSLDLVLVDHEEGVATAKETVLIAKDPELAV